MIWKTKPEPKVGDRREYTTFAWLPIECTGGITVWWERVRVTEYLGLRGGDFTTGATVNFWETLSIVPVRLLPLLEKGSTAIGTRRKDVTNGEVDHA